MKRSQREALRTWVAALESGEYRQCRGQLHDGEGFCCLGVAEDVLRVGDWRCDGEGRGWTIAGSYLFITPQTAKRLGLDSWQMGVLAQMNDGAPLSEPPRSFPEIAAKIREWFPEAFED